MQSLLRMVYPPKCICCNGTVAEDGKLCSECRKETPFIVGLSCDSCGLPLSGSAEESVRCDECLQTPRPWMHGRAALVYSGSARRMILGFKHGDRQELANPFASWMVAATHDLIERAPIIVPVPIHWSRMIRRKYNQAALLGNGIAVKTGLQVLPAGLARRRRTQVMDEMNLEQRRANINAAIVFNPRYAPIIRNREVLLVDDVMTSGATLASCSLALLDAGADQVFVTVLARVAKHP